MDMDAFMAFVGKFAGDLGAVVAAGNVVVGDRLGLYRALAEAGPSTAAELAARTGTDERYVAEWLAGQAAGGYLEYGDGRFSMTAEQAFALADPSGPVDVAGAFQLALGAVAAVPAIAEAFRTGAGVGWHEQSADVFTGCERFFRAGYAAHLVQDWLPALPGIVSRLSAGGSVADVGCGLGASSVLLASAFPAARVSGSDYHEGSISLAVKRAADAGVADRVSFETASATTFSGAGYDLVTTFDCLHDMGDPVGAARHIRSALADGGSWLIVEPMAADTVEGNLNPVGRVYYNFSTLLCLPNARSQDGHAGSSGVVGSSGSSGAGGSGAGAMLGAQAGEAAIRSVVLAAGFGSFRRAAQTPFNLVYEAKP
ncbi:MAG TPA: class I SAM-dependent methyltransferase [Trebonia sp.]|nr:class I SAM-dependent methyltransferase [Trebonia sp.]